MQHSIPPTLLEKRIEEKAPCKPPKMKNVIDNDAIQEQTILKSNPSSFHGSDFNIDFEKISESW